MATTTTSTAGKRIILITGANSGIGHALASAFASQPPSPQNKNHIILCARNPAKGLAALTTLRTAHPHASLEHLSLDITSETSITAATEHLRATCGRVDVLINNAGALPSRGNFASRLREALDVNAIGATVLTAALVPLLRAAAEDPDPVHGAPRIVNISSGFGSISRRLDPGSARHEVSAAEYRISKAALNMASACMRVDYGGMGEGQGKVRGLRVFVVCPGFTRSGLSAETAREGSGARRAEEAVGWIVGVVQGERDGEEEGFLWEGGRYGW